jgi:branched-chain amino acid aminotransferase
MELAKARGIEVIERHIRPEELPYVKEIFLTGTAAEITPVGRIGELRFMPGRLTAQLAEDYTKATRG